MLAPAGERLSVLKLGRAPKAVAGSKGWEFAPKAATAIWLARTLHNNRRTDIDILLEHIVADRKASAPILSRPCHALNSSGGLNHQDALAQRIKSNLLFRGGSCDRRAWSAPGACGVETHPDSIKPLHAVVLICKSLALDCIRFRDKFVSLFKHVSFRQLAHVEKTRFQRSVIFE